jgi:hypothetical protein
MHLPTTKTLLGLAATAAMAIAPVAGAQDAATPAKVTGAYLYLHTLPQDGQRLATLVFKTNRQLPRRFDGMIRARASVAGQASSIASVGGKASRCYQANVRVRKDGTILGSSSGGGTKRTKARVGAKLGVEILTEKGATPIRRTLVLRKARAGDASGRPLGC